MANKGITKAQVWEICDLLHAQGIEPTINKIKDKLGTGSFTTISNHLGSWRQGEASKNEIEHKAIPKTVEDDLMTMASRMWTVCTVETEKDIAAIKNEHKEEIKKKDDNLKRQQTELNELLKKLDSITTERDALLKENAKLEKDVIKQTARNEANEELLAKLSK